MHTGRGYWAVKAAGAVALGLALWLFVAVNLFTFPPSDQPGRVDAVILLGGASKERLPLALEEVRKRGGEPALVLSTTDTRGNIETDDICQGIPSMDTPISVPFDTKPSGIGTVACFHPYPLNTRGETAAIERIVSANGWSRILVITSTYHAPRARLLMSQCLNARVNLAASQPSLTPWQWLRRYVIETGGLLDVSLRPAC